METLTESLSEWYDYLKAEKQVSSLTIRNYKHYMERFVSWINGTKQPIKKVEDINQRLVRKYRVWLADFLDNRGEQLKPVTQSYHIIALRSFLRWLTKNNYQVIAPDKIDLPKTNSQRIEFLNSEQIERLLNMPSISKPQGLRDKAILELLYSTGLRVSELVKLNRDQIDLKRGEFGIKGKGGRVRVVFLSQRAIDWLSRYLVTRNDDWDPLFINYKGIGKSVGASLVDAQNKKTKNNTGTRATTRVAPTENPNILKHDKDYGRTKRLTARSVQRIVKKYAKKAKLPIEITPHGIRHSFATDLLRAGADIRSVQALLGHKNISTTQIYTHVTDPQLKEVHTKFHDKS